MQAQGIYRSDHRSESSNSDAARTIATLPMDAGDLADTQLLIISYAMYSMS
jgi:hypothetical protein